MNAKGFMCLSGSAIFLLMVNVVPLLAQPSVARQWNELLLDAVRMDTPRPTVHARNLFHTSAAMYDTWATYDPVSVGYFSSTKVNVPLADLQSAREEALSYASYRVLVDRFHSSPGAVASLGAFDAKMAELGYDPGITTVVGSSPAAVGNRVAAAILSRGLTDGSNQQNNYGDTTGYVPVNPPLDVSRSGTILVDKNRWQPLTIGATTQRFLTPHWGNAEGFGMPTAVSGMRTDAGQPPWLGGDHDQIFRDSVVDVIRYSSWLDPSDGVTIDISPGSNGNNPLGTSHGTGHAVNPMTGTPYESHMVRRGDYGRVLAEFWADGPQSETPPGHWNVILNDVSNHPLTEKRFGGVGPIVDDMQWDVKSYFALNAALHNAAITAWDNKEAYDYVRPISMIRYMGGRGQASDSSLPSYDPDGLPLQSGLIELITEASTAAGDRHHALAGHEGEIAIRAWQGVPVDPDTTSGVDWIRATDWMPYQADTFVTPPFAAYTSGHSTFSRAAAEVLTALTGNEYFPGGIGEYPFEAGSYLTFEDGPSQDVVLQWATYFDAADEAGLSRLYGGIHVAADDFSGRVSGSLVGISSYEHAQTYFAGVPEPDAGWLLVVALLHWGWLRRP